MISQNTKNRLEAADYSLREAGDLLHEMMAWLGDAKMPHAAGKAAAAGRHVNRALEDIAAVHEELAGVDEAP